MMLREYLPEDYREISSWCCMRDLAPMPEWSLPDTGVIVPNVACGFLIYTSNHCGILDFFISNPHAGIKERRDAMDMIMEELMHCAKETNLKMVQAAIQLDATKELAAKFGLQPIGDFTYFQRGF